MKLRGVLHGEGILVILYPSVNGVQVLCSLRELRVH